MSGRRRRRYACALGGFTDGARAGHPPSRRPRRADLEALAALMLDAYAGTVDDDGETLDDAQRELRSYFAGEPLLEHSVVIADRRGPRAACLVDHLAAEGAPRIAYLMTRREAKRRGLARAALGEALARLEAGGYRQVWATITEGNVPSEALFRAMGFERSD